MEISAYQYLLLGSGTGFVLVGLCERIGRKRLSRLLRLDPGEAEFLGAGTLLYFILFAVGDHLHEWVSAAVTVCTFMVWAGLIRMAYRNRRSGLRESSRKAEERLTDADGVA